MAAHEVPLSVITNASTGGLMRELPFVQRLSARSMGIALTGVLIAGLAIVAGSTLASAQSPGGMRMSASAGKAAVGNTRGWYRGRTVRFHYTKDFFCRRPPSSKAVSHCELGDNYQRIPAGEFDPLYVVVPIGFTPRERTLQCPTAGRCIDHPHRIDLSRVFGSGTGNTLTPPHSHVVTTEAGGDLEWWNVDVVGVTSRAAWHRIVRGKSYHAIQRMRSRGNTHVTTNIPTNLFLFFAVHG
jgi:hypothetical protein